MLSTDECLAAFRCNCMLNRDSGRQTTLSVAGSISDGLIVVDLVKDPVRKGSLARSTTPVIDPALLRSVA